MASPSLIVRFRRWLTWGLGIAVLLYVIGSVYFGFQEVGAAFQRYRWVWYLPVLGLTLVNYAIRVWKWDYLLQRLQIRLPLRENLLIFGAGLAMVISPGKAGELLKPYLVRARTGAPMATTIPVLISERLTDGIALLILAAISVGTYASDRAIFVVGPAVTVALGLAVLSSKSLSLWILAALGKLPVISKVAHKLEEMYLAMRACLAPAPLVLTVIASLLAWGAECVGYMLVFRGFDRAVSLDLSTFLYSFATVAGGAMPGGLGVADGALVGGAIQLIPGLDHGEAVAAALLIRVATLWFGVLIGAVVLTRIGGMLGGEEPTLPEGLDAPR